MRLNMRTGHWLNKGMDIETQRIDEERSAAVSIAGVELMPSGSGREPRIRYVLRFVSGDYELGARPLDTDEVERGMRENASLVREAFEWLKRQDGVSGAFLGHAAEYERAFEYGLRENLKRAKARSL